MLSADLVVGVVVEWAGQALGQVLREVTQSRACGRRVRENALNVVLLTEAGHMQRLVGGAGASDVPWLRSPAQVHRPPRA